MKKNRLSLFLALVMFFFIFVGFTPERVKADDVMVSFTDQPLNTDWVSYQLVGGSPAQFLRVVVPSTGKLTIEGRSFTKVKLVLYNNNLTKKVVYGNWGWDLEIYGTESEPSFYTFNDFLDPGTYFAKLSSNENKGVSGRFDLKLTFKDSASNEVLPNETHENAMFLNEGTEIKGVITKFDEFDFYKFEVAKESRININFSSFCKSLDAELLDGDLRVIGTIVNGYYEADNGNPRYFNYLDILSPGTYYIRLKADFSGDYKLKYNIINQIKKIRIKKVKKLYVGDKKKLKVVISPKNASMKNLIWSSSDTWIAEINDRGVITGKNEGTVEITATARDGSNVVGRRKIKVVKRK